MDKAGSQSRRSTSDGRTPPGADRDLGAGQGQQRGGVKVMGHILETGIQCGAQRQEAEAGKGVGDVQVDGALCRDRRWGVGTRYRV